MAELSDNANWFETDASNQTSTPHGWPEGQMPSTVNDCARAMMGGLKRFWNRVNPVVTVTPSGAAWTLTTSNPAYPTAYVEGESYTFHANGDAIGNDTFQVNTLGAKPIYTRVWSGANWAPLVIHDIAYGGDPRLVYHAGLNGGAGGFELQNPFTPITQDGAGGIAVPGNVSVGGNAVTGNLTVSGAAPQITLGNATSNWITWANSGVGGPTFNTSSPGTKLLLYQNASASAVDYAIGLQSGAMWFSIAGNTSSFLWYGGTTQVGKLDGTGALTLTGSASIAGNGVAYPGVGGSHYFAFTWDNVHVAAHVDGGGSPGALANYADLASYLPVSGGTVSGALTVSSTLTVGGELDTQDIVMPNNLALYGLSTGGGKQRLIGMFADNALHISYGGGPVTDIDAGLNITGNIFATGNLTVNGSASIAGEGIVYPGVGGGHYIAFTWDGAHVVAHVDGGGSPGALANYADLASYLPLSGGTVSGSLTVNGNVTANFSLVCGGSGGPYWYNNGGRMSTNQTIQSFGILPTADNSSSSGLSGTAWAQVASYWFNTVSARALKADIAPIESALGKVMALVPVNFHWKDEGWLGDERVKRKLHAGFVADEVLDVMGHDFGGYSDQGGEGIAYNELVALLWAAVRELAAKVH
jgi:hypothetical protein